MYKRILELRKLNNGLRLFAKQYATAPSPSPHTPKAAGDISAVFPSLRGGEANPLPLRFRDVKKRLVQGHEDRLQASWHILLAELRHDIEVIKAEGSSIIPEISFSDVKYNQIESMTTFRDKLKTRGVAIIRGVITEQEALGWKELLRRYIQTNPSTKGRAFSYLSTRYFHTPFRVVLFLVVSCLVYTLFLQRSSTAFSHRTKYKAQR